MIFCVVDSCHHERQFFIKVDGSGALDSVTGRVLVALVAALWKPADEPAPNERPPQTDRWAEAIEAVVNSGAIALTVDVPVTDRQILDWDLSRADQVTTVQLDAGGVSDVAVAHLAQLPQLQHLRLLDSPVTDSSAAVVGQSRGTADPQPPGLPNDGRRTEGIGGIHQPCGTLRIGSAEFDASTCEAIATIGTLRMLHLIGYPVTDEGLRKLASLPHLETLYLDGAAVTDGGYRLALRTSPPPARSRQPIAPRRRPRRPRPSRISESFQKHARVLINLHPPALRGRVEPQRGRALPGEAPTLPLSKLAGG